MKESQDYLRLYDLCASYDYFEKREKNAYRLGTGSYSAGVCVFSPEGHFVCSIVPDETCRYQQVLDLIDAANRGRVKPDADLPTS